jgi:histidinol dehydrogenase
VAKELAGHLLDRQLVKAAANGMSGVDMEERFGIPAAEAVSRVRSVLNSTRSAYDDYENRQLLVISLKETLMQVKASGVNVSDPKHMEAVTKLTLAIDRVESNNAKITEEMLNTVSEAQARRLLDMLEKAYKPIREWLLDQYGMLVDFNELDKVFQEGLRHAAQGYE